MNEYKVGVSKQKYALFENEIKEYGTAEFVGSCVANGGYYLYYTLRNITEVDMSYLKLKYELINHDVLQSLLDRR